MPRPGTQKHRTPPKPSFYHTARLGQCKLCGLPIFRDTPNGKRLHRRAQWHPECALTWTIMNSPRDARRYVFVRDKGICSSCGTNCQPEGGEQRVAEIIRQIMCPPKDRMQWQPSIDLGEWELDHIIPLSEAGDDLTLWKLSNMATLCPPCHKLKTREDQLRYAPKKDRKSPQST